MIKEKWPYILVIFLLIGGGFAYLKCQSQPTPVNWEASQPSKEQKQPNVEPEKKQTSADKKPEIDIVVDLKGAVKHPGVYQMKPGDRVVDVLRKAGGLSEKADKTKVNLAKKLADEMMIYIPMKGEQLPSNMGNSTTTTNESTASGTGKININTASEQELEQLPGIGPSKAGAIIEYRKKNGAFQTINDLDKVSGIGEKSVERMKSQVTVN